MRIRGWMGRADQTTKVKGMFVRPEQVAEIAKRHPELGRLRSSSPARRKRRDDAEAECASPGEVLREQVAATLRTVVKLGGDVELVGAGQTAQRRQGHRGRAGVV